MRANVTLGEVIGETYKRHRRLEVQKRIVLRFTPISALWLKLVEWFFNTLTQKQIRRGVFQSVKAL